jgi:hypothetical protein
MTVNSPGAGLVMLALSSTSTKPWSPEALSPSAPTMVTIRSFGPSNVIEAVAVTLTMS